MRVALYARVSTANKGQDTETQLLPLREFVKARKFDLFKEYVDIGVSGSKDSRPALNQLMNDARKRRIDAVLVFRFDRFARSTRHLIQALEEFRALDVEFISYQENVDTSTPLGKAMFVIVGAMAELERNIIVERVKAGLARAKAKGKVLGRPKGTRFDVTLARSLRSQGMGIRAIAKQMGASKSTVANHLSN